MWPRFVAFTVLLGIGAVFAVENVWVAANRSTIPLALNDRIVAKEVRPEKHPGKDDVYLLRFESRHVMQVDRAVYDAVEVGENLQKAAWSREMRHDNGLVTLAWSTDFHGMAWAMPLVVIILVSTAAMQVQFRTRNAP